MKKKVVINASPDLKQAAKRNKREPIIFIRDNLVVPSKLSLIAKDKKYFIRTYGCQANVLDVYVHDNRCYILRIQLLNIFH